MENNSYGSFAFWYKQAKHTVYAKRAGHIIQARLINSASSNSPKLEAIMNFNLWCECGWNTEPFLDIGFRLNNLNQAEELYFFVPFSINNKQKNKYIEDLGCKFNKTELVDSLFNKGYYTTIAANTKNIGVICNDKKTNDEFNIYQLDIEHDIELNNFANGTIIKIRTENIIGTVSLNNSNVYYLRFRIKNIPLNFLIHKYEPPHGVLQGWFNTTYMIDFRYHNIRSLHKTLIEKFNEKGNKVVQVKELHFFLMTKSYVGVANDEYKSIRKIEQDVWDEYVDYNDTTDLVAYHYVSKPKDSFVKSSEIFTKFSVGKTAMSVYVGVALLFGIIGSLLGNYLESIIKTLLKMLF